MTIFAPTAFLADALDDAVFILGPEKGLALVDSYPDCAAMIVDAHEQGLGVEVAARGSCSGPARRRTGL